MNLEKQKKVQDVLTAVFGKEFCSEPKGVIVSLNGQPTSAVSTVVKGAIAKSALVDFENKMKDAEIIEFDYSIKRSGAYVSFRVV
jgi:hypothetical protein